MRTLALLLALASLAVANDRQPIRVTSRPVFTPNACLPVEIKSRCVTIDGIDYDVEPILTEYRRAWYWPGNTEQSLRVHFKTSHRTRGIDSLTFDELQKLHAVLHERELRVKIKTTTQAPVRSACPGGVCPTNNATGSRSRLFFRWR
jgi:hypothetical protein